MPLKDREARNAYFREWYAKNSTKHKQRTAKTNRRYREWFRDLKSTFQCARCGESHPATIDFHHSDPATKETSIYAAIHKGWAKSRILAEIEKCEPLCANCHRKEHWTE